MKRFAIIPSGGKGLRCGGSIPKQYIKFNGKELLAHTLGIFQDCSLIDGIVIAAQKDYFDLVEEIKLKYGLTKIIKIVEGGTERQNSVHNALLALKAEDDDLVAVHDAARPALPQRVLLNSLKSAEIFDNALVAIKARDTLVKANRDNVESFIDRETIYYAQTPQIFRYSILLRSLNEAEAKGIVGTDESSIVRAAGFNVKIVEGSILNFKVTTTEDVELFSDLINARSK